jgi:hypothetical protein
MLIVSVASQPNHNQHHHHRCLYGKSNVSSLNAGGTSNPVKHAAEISPNSPCSKADPSNQWQLLDNFGTRIQKIEWL